MLKPGYAVTFTETTLNVALAELLQKRELQSLGEALIHRTKKGVGKKPDVLLTVNGVKIILEGKFKIPGVVDILEKQCIERIENGLCEICVGVVYEEMTAKTLTPTMKDIKELLKSAQYNAAVYAIAPVEGIQLSLEQEWSKLPPGVSRNGWQELDLDDLCALVRSCYTNVVSEDILGKAVTSFADALQNAYVKLSAVGDSSTLAKKMFEIMELPEVENDKTDES